MTLLNFLGSMVAMLGMIYVQQWILIRLWQSPKPFDKARRRETAVAVAFGVAFSLLTLMAIAIWL